MTTGEPDEALQVDGIMPRLSELSLRETMMKAKLQPRQQARLLARLMNECDKSRYSCYTGVIQKLQGGTAQPPTFLQLMND